ncbi:MAG: hypothetical protein AAGG47_13015 [Pseudomonadota bacterium]
MTHPKTSKSSQRELTAMEQSDLDRLIEHAERSPKVTLKSSDGVLKIAVAEKDTQLGSAQFLRSLGTCSTEFAYPLIKQMVNAGTKGEEIDTETASFMLEVVRGLEPRDQVEAMLGAQMAAVHLAMMTMARRLNHVDTIPQQDSAERAFNKLARTFAAQTEALKRYRTGGEQKIMVQHVNVEDGGQAVVGNVTTTKGAGGT